MRHRHLKLSHEEIELIEKSMQFYLKELRKLSEKNEDVFSVLQVQDKIKDHIKKVETLMLDIKEGGKDV